MANEISMMNIGKRSDVDLNGFELGKRDLNAISESLKVLNESNRNNKVRKD